MWLLKIWAEGEVLRGLEVKLPCTYHVVQTQEMLVVQHKRASIRSTWLKITSTFLFASCSLGERWIFAKKLDKARQAKRSSTISRSGEREGKEKMRWRKSYSFFVLFHLGLLTYLFCFCGDGRSKSPAIQRNGNTALLPLQSVEST